MQQALREIRGMGGAFKPDPRKVKTGKDVLAHLQGLSDHVRIIRDMLEERLIQAGEMEDPQAPAPDAMAEPVKSELQTTQDEIDAERKDKKPKRDRMKRGGKDRSEDSD